MTDLSENIVILRKQNKMSQSDLARHLFVTPQAISRWERGETEPDVETLKKLAELFNVSIEELIYGPTSKLSKNMRVIIHRSYFIFSIAMFLISIIAVVLIALDLDFYLIFFGLLFFVVVYFVFLMVCEIIQNRLKKIPVRKEKNK